MVRFEDNCAVTFDPMFGWRKADLSDLQPVRSMLRTKGGRILSFSGIAGWQSASGSEIEAEAERKASARNLKRRLKRWLNKITS